MTAPKVKMSGFRGTLSFAWSVLSYNERLKEQSEKWKKYEEQPSEFLAISWLRMKKGWNHIKPTWLPQI